MQRGAVGTDVLRVAGSSTGSLRIVGAEPKDERSVSYDELNDLVDRLAVGMAERGIAPQDRVVLPARTDLGFVSRCFALWRRGAVVIPLVPPERLGSAAAWLRRTREIVQKAGVKAFLADEQDVGLDLGIPHLRVQSGASEGRLTEPGLDPSEVALIQFTSGSTGRPRGIVLDHQAIVAQVSARDRWFGGDSAEGGVFSWLPLYHDLGFIDSMVRPIHSGQTVALMPTEHFVRSPLRWIEELSARRATHTAGPNAAFGAVAKELERKPLGELDLSALRHAGSGGEAVDPTTLERFTAAGARYGLHPDTCAGGYGLAEATCVLTARLPRTGWVVDDVEREALARGSAIPAKGPGSRVSSIASVGRPLDGVEIAIADDDGNPLEDRTVGEIVAKSPAVMRGYLDDPDATAAAFRDGWLRTGDTGYLVGDELFVTGRIKDLIIVNGQNLYATDIERIVERVQGIKRGGTVAIPVSGHGTEGMGVLAETTESSGSEAELRAAVVQEVMQETGVPPRSVILLPPKSLPKTTSGKLRRAEAKRMFEVGELGPARVARPPGAIDPIEATLMSIWTEILGLSGLTLDDDFFEVGGTSLQAASVVAEVEERLGCELPFSALASAPTIRALARAIKSGGMGSTEPVVALSSGGPTKLFGVPGVGGTVLHFAALTRALGEGFSFYGFHLEVGEWQTGGSVEHIAARLVERLRSADPGPYNLIGYSVGGVVAFEVAAQLISSGASVGFLGLIDSTTPVRGRALAMRLRHLKDPRASWDAVRWKLQAFKTRRSRLSRGVPRADLRGEELARAKVLSVGRVAARYKPSSLPIRIDYFRAAGGVEVPLSDIDHWRRLTTELKMHAVEASSHGALMRQPWVEGLAAAIRAALADVGVHEPHGGEAR